MNPYTGPERRRFPRDGKAQRANLPFYMDERRSRLGDRFRPNWWGIMCVLAGLSWAAFFGYWVYVYYLGRIL